MTGLEIDARVKLAYDESVRGLNLQSTAVDEPRNADATVAAAIRTPVRLRSWWPSEDWELVYDPAVLDEDYFVGEVVVTQMCRAMSFGNAGSHHKNQGKLNDRFKLFRLASIALLLDVLLWLVGIGIR